MNVIAALSRLDLLPAEFPVHHASALTLQRLRKFCEVAALAALTSGCLVLCAWIFHFQVLTSVLSGLVTMKANAAFSLIFSGAALWLLLPENLRTSEFSDPALEPHPWNGWNSWSAWRARAGYFLASLVAAISAATIGEYLFGIDLRIDGWLFRGREAAATFSAARMPPAISTAFLAIGLALLGLNWKTRRQQRPSQTLSLWSILVAITVIGGYIYHAAAGERISLNPNVAVLTALVLLLLSGGVFFARPETGIASELTRSGSGTVMARRLLPAVFIVPYFLGWIRLEGYFAGLYGSELDLPLFATTNVVVLASLIWSNARKMNREFGMRSEAELEIRRLNATLEHRVRERTEALTRQTLVLAQQGALLEFAHDAVILNDIHGRVLSWNRGAEAMYGWPAELAIGKIGLDLLQTESTHSVEEIQTQLLEQDYWEGELIQYTRVGVQLNVSTRWALQRGTDGQPLQILTLSDDVTANNQIEKKLYETTFEAKQANLYLAEQKFAIDQHAIVTQTDAQGTILDVNDRFCAISQYTREELIGKNHRIGNSGRHPREFFAEMYRTISNGMVWRGEIENRAKDGSTYWVDTTIVPVIGEDSRPVRYVAIRAEITNSKRAELEIALLAKRLSLATAIASVGVWELDVASNALTWDATMFDIYGLSGPNAIPYEQWSATLHADDLPRAEAMLRLMIEEKGQSFGEFRITRADGAVRIISAVQRVVLDSAGNVLRVIGVNYDITERRAAEKTLEQNAKDQLRFKDEFLSHVSHELRSPLTAIKQFSTILLDGLAGELNSKQREYQQIVLKNIGHLQSMIDDLLHVTRMETGKMSVEPERMSILDAVTDALTTVRNTAFAKGISLTSEVAPNLAPAYADPNRVRQALIILLDNAIKFTPPGGSILVEAGAHGRDAAHLFVEVSDTGCGIGAQHAEKIFERLYQEADSSEPGLVGLGLGLYICKDLVNRQGGLIWFKSEPGKGSAFTFTLPVFSLTRLITPLRRGDIWPATSMALVVAEMLSPEQFASEQAKCDWSREIRGLLQRCLLPDLDVLLPKMSSGHDQDRFFIAAFADEKGALILTSRIREQFGRLIGSEPFPQLRVSYNMLETFPRTIGARWKMWSAV